jgi:hypothetical protein
MTTMTKYEQYTYDQLKPTLENGETIQTTAFLFNKSLMGMVLLGALSMLGSGYFFAAATDRRLLLIKTKMGFISLKMENNGVTEIPYSNIEAVEPGGALNQKTVTINTKDGSKLKFRLNTLAKFMSGQKKFLDDLPQLVEQAKGRG